jgi:hypothetical protein
MTQMPAPGADDRSDLPKDGPLQDLSKTFSEKLKVWNDFWRTRKAVLRNLEVAKFSKQDLLDKGLLNPWKFNLIQSGFATLPAIMVGRVLSTFAPSPGEQQPIDPSLEFVPKVWTAAQPMISSIYAFLWPLVLPFVLFMVARMMAWGSLKKVDSNPLVRKSATGAYLYLDGAFGFYPQMVSTLGLVIATAHLSTTIADIGFVLFGVGAVWQGLLSRWILVRKLFDFNGYSKQFKWFWMIRDKGRNFGPWNKYIFALGYAVPIAVLVSELAVYSVSALIGLAEAAARQFLGTA